MRQIIFILISLYSFSAAGKNPIGLPDIVNYDKTVYGGGTSNWDIQQDRNGIVYFANNEGLLTFDGTYWKIYPLPNKTIVRSVMIAADNKIYVGGQDEFGYFSPGDNGKLRFFSLKDKIPAKYRSFEDIWDITFNDDAVFFRSEKRIFKLSNNAIKVFESSSDWIFLGKANNKIIAQDKAKGLLSFANDKWTPFLENSLPQGFLTTSISGYNKDSLLVSSWEHGLYTIQQNTISKLNYYNANAYAGEQITQVCKLNNDMLAIATNIHGCYIVSKNGSLIYNFSRKSGLQNNSILSVLKDNNNNIWLGTTNGIDFIANNDAIKHINPEIFDNGVGHVSMIHKNNLYLGLSSALYKISLSATPDITLLNDEFKYVTNSGGQVWGMNQVGGHLLLGKHEGAFEVKGDVAIPITTGNGYWNFLPFNHPDGPFPLILSGNYNGIDLFSYKNESFRRIGYLPELTESARFITVANDNLVWASHPYKGIYKINLTSLKQPKIKLYTKNHGLPSTFNNHVYSVKNKIIISTERGIYEYNATKDRFERSAFFNNIFGNLYIRYLKEDGEGNIWFIQEKNLGVCHFTAKSHKLIYIPELNGKVVGGFEHINPIDTNNVIVGTQKGFYHINYSKYLKSLSSINVRISLVKAIGRSDSLLFGGYSGEVNEANTQKSIPEVNYGWNSFHFEYSSTLNKSQANIEYSYFLKGFDKKWSEFNKRTEKDYTNLPYGDYVFYVKARNNFGNESSISSYNFSILPPWYQSVAAYFLYSVLGICLVYYLYKRQHKKFLQQQIKFEEEQERIKYLHQLEIDKSDKEIVKLKNEKLEAEIDAKNSELASTAMHLVQKAELLSKIKDELGKLDKHITDEEQLHELKKIIRLLTSEEKADEGWEQFSMYFDKVHTNFLKNLKTAYPGITGNDLRLAAYLKMNLSTKEIAQLMKISPRGVEISRYRLRKKLQIPGEVHLFEFFRDFQGESLENL